MDAAWHSEMGRAIQLMGGKQMYNVSFLHRMG
jgi:hypothetical protein